MKQLYILLLKIFGCFTYLIIFLALFGVGIKLKAIFPIAVSLLMAFGIFKALAEALKNPNNEMANDIFIGAGILFVSIAVSLAFWSSLKQLFHLPYAPSFVLGVLLYNLFLFLFSRLAGYTLGFSRTYGLRIFKIKGR